MRASSAATVACALACVALATPPLSGQDRDSDQADAWRQYEAEKKSEWAAAGLEVLIPVVGHAYAGDAGRGIKPLAVSAGGLALAIVGAAMCQESFDGTCINDGETALILLGVGAYLLGRIWGVVSALETAQEHNAGLRQRLNLTLESSGAGLRLGLSYAFPF